MKSGNLKSTVTSKRTVISYKRFVLYLTVICALFVTANYLIWKFATEDLLTKKYDGGNLARMGYLRSMKEYRKISYDLPVRHLEMKGYSGQKVDVLTIGDSFSNGGGEGRNSFYQDYIASINNMSVLNVPPYPSDDLIMNYAPVTTLSLLNNSGYLDIIRPKYILIQSTEQYCIPRFATPFNFSRNITREALTKYYAEKVFDPNYLPKVGFINKGNLNYLFYNIMYLFSDNAFRGLVYKKHLTQELFSVNGGKTLIFHSADLQGIPLITAETVKKVNDNLNRLSDILAAKGIRLIFMPVVSKYNLYSSFIDDNRYPNSAFFEELRPLSRRYQLIDTKAILMARLHKGEQDIFHADDTHWSWRASRAVFENLSFSRDYFAKSR